MFQNSVRLVKDVDGLGDRGVVSRLTTTSPTGATRVIPRRAGEIYRLIPLPNMRRGLRTRPRQQSPSPGSSRLKNALTHRRVDWRRFKPTWCDISAHVPPRGPGARSVTDERDPARAPRGALPADAVRRPLRSHHPRRPLSPEVRGHRPALHLRRRRAPTPSSKPDRSDPVGQARRVLIDAADVASPSLDACGLPRRPSGAAEGQVGSGRTPRRTLASAGDLDPCPSIDGCWASAPAWCTPPPH